MQVKFPQASIDRINGIKDKLEYKDLMDIYLVSESPLKHEAIELLKRTHPQFDDVDKMPSSLLLKDIQDRQGDLDDFN